MKRRDFLYSTAVASGTLVAPLARSETRPCPPETVSVTGGSRLSEGCGSTAQSDWAARTQGSGVRWFHNFTDPVAEVEKYRANDGDPSTLVHIPDGGPAGFGGAIRLNRPPGQSASGYQVWMRPFDDSGLTSWRQLNSGTWTKGMYGPPENRTAFPSYGWSGVDEYYLQFRFRYNGGWASNATAWNKILYLTSTPGAQTRSNFIYDIYKTGVLGGYTNTGGQYPGTLYAGLQDPQFGAAGPGTIYHNQPPWNTTCYYRGDGSHYSAPACFALTPDTWYTLYFRVKLGKQASDGPADAPWKTTSNGIVEIAFAPPGARTYTYIFRKTDWQWLYAYPGDTPSPLSAGHNRMILTTYPQNWLKNGTPWYTEVAQVVFSHAPIPCPAV